MSCRKATHTALLKLIKLLFDRFHLIPGILNRFFEQCFIQLTVIAYHGFFAVQADFCGCTVNLVDGFGDCVDAVFAVHAGNLNGLLSDDRILEFFLLRRKASTAASTAGSLAFKMLDGGFYTKKYKYCND